MAIHFKPKFFFDKFTSRRRKFYEGARKVLYNGPEQGTLVLYFKDGLGNEEDQTNKGVLNNRISQTLFSRLGEIGISHHVKKRINMREQVVFQADPLPFNVTIHNMVDEELADRLHIQEGLVLSTPILEFAVQNKPHSVIGESHIFSMGWCMESELEILTLMARRANDFLRGQFLALGLRLMSVTLEFGRVYNGDFADLMLIDELSPDTFKVWDIELGCPLSSDERYKEISMRLGLLDKGGPADLRELKFY